MSSQDTLTPTNPVDQAGVVATAPQQEVVKSVIQPQKFVITEAMVKGLLSQGLTVDEMAEKITEQSGIKCSAAVIRAAAKAYNLSLRNKPKKSPVVFEQA